MSALKPSIMSTSPTTPKPSPIQCAGASSIPGHGSGSSQFISNAAMMAATNSSGGHGNVFARLDAA